MSRQLRSNRFLVVGACGLLIIVGLLSFGEMVRRGHYHLDGSRGWDLPAPVSLDAGHFQLPSVPVPQIVLRVVQHLNPSERLVALSEIPSFIPDTPWVWLGLRPPPQV
jgi:hypothetical protein